MRNCGSDFFSVFVLHHLHLGMNRDSFFSVCGIAAVRSRCKLCSSLEVKLCCSCCVPWKSGTCSFQFVELRWVQVMSISSVQVSSKSELSSTILKFAPGFKSGREDKM